MTGPGKGDDFFRCNGGRGDARVLGRGFLKTFLEPRPDLPASLEGELKEGRRAARGEQVGRSVCTRPTTKASRAS